MFVDGQRTTYRANGSNAVGCRETLAKQPKDIGAAHLPARCQQPKHPANDEMRDPAASGYMGTVTLAYTRAGARECQNSLDKSLIVLVRDVTPEERLLGAQPTLNRLLACPRRQNSLDKSLIVLVRDVTPEERLLGAQPTLNRLLPWPRRRGALLLRLMSSSFCRSAI
jgi:hypothetical protein